METIKFTLSGKTGFFRNPEFSDPFRPTFDHIHKMALLGLLGGKLGLGGYISQKLKKDNGIDSELEFQSKLQGLKISIIPSSPIFTKKILKYSNTTGHASKQEGGILLINEQTLYNPKWDIYIMNTGEVDSGIFEKLKEFLLDKKAIFESYLGKNNHFAYITDVELLNADKLDSADITCINSLFIDDKDDKCLELNKIRTYDGEEPSFVRFSLPVGRKKNTGYILKSFIMSNLKVKNVLNAESFYRCNDKTLFFF